MNRADLVRRVQSRLTFPLDLNRAGLVADALFAVIADELRAGGAVKVRDFGTFRPQKSRATRRRGFDGALRAVPERWKVRFTPSESLTPAETPVSSRIDP